MKHQWLAKIVLMIVWPPMAALLAAMMLGVLVLAWFAIPAATIKRKDDGTGYTAAFPWCD